METFDPSTLGAIEDVTEAFVNTGYVDPNDRRLFAYEFREENSPEQVSKHIRDIDIDHEQLSFKFPYCQDTSLDYRYRALGI